SRWEEVTCAPRSPLGQSFCANSPPRASRSGDLWLCPAERHQYDFGGNADAERHDAAAEAAGDDDVAIFPDMAVGELLPGRRDRRPAEQALLPAMGMTGELQRNARGHARGDIGLMCEQDRGGIIGDFGERRAEIVDADAPHRAKTPCRHVGELIAEAGKPERAAVLLKPFCVVLVDGNA